MEIAIKTPKEIDLIKEGGSKLKKVKALLKKEIKIGKSAKELDDLAESLIKNEGGTSSFKMVPGYKWTTCINVNEGVVHGIPKEEIVFKKGDIVSLDVGMFYRGFHTDTSLSVGLGANEKTQTFLDIGQNALKKAILEAKAENRIYDISYVIESTLLTKGFNPIRALVGHGVGRELHEYPQIPCYVSGSRLKSPLIPIGACLAIEVMYSEGSGEIEKEKDGWTIVTSDDKISALFEETVIVGQYGPIIVT